MLKVTQKLLNYNYQYNLFHNLVRKLNATYRTSRSSNHVPFGANCCTIIILRQFTSSTRCLSSNNRNFAKKERIPTKVKEKKPTIKVWRNMTISDLAVASTKPLDDVFEAMLFVENTDQYDKKHSSIDNINITRQIAEKLGFRCQEIPRPSSLKLDTKIDQDVKKRPSPDSKDLVKKSPVVTIMGHVDHGKTTLLDSLRNTSVVKDEFGGITQHIGAFKVKIPNGDSITFLDTPGHAAFSAMRSRGAQATDIVILVVAADDGVMEQTVESIKFANESKVPIIVAINKVDKPKIDLDHVKKGLISNGIQLEETGGDIQAVEISAKTGKNLPQLLESILTLAEVLEIKGDPKGLVEGVVLESKVDKGRGKLATVLVQRGTLKKGCYIVAGTAFAKVRSMFDEWGNLMQTVPPGSPAQVIGWRDLPSAGDEILEVETEKRAKDVIGFRIDQSTEHKEKDDLVAIQDKVNEHLSIYKEELKQRRASGFLRRKKKQLVREKQFVESDQPTLDIVVKGDVDGSVEAILDIIETYHYHDACKFDVIHFGVGEVTESDVELSETFDGIVYAFNVKTPSNVKKTAQSKGVPIKNFNVIYKLVDDLKDEISKRLPPNIYRRSKCIGGVCSDDRREEEDARRGLSMHERNVEEKSPL